MEMVCKGMKRATYVPCPGKLGVCIKGERNSTIEATGNFGIGTRMSSVQKMDFALCVPKGMGVAGASTLTLNGETR